MIWWIIGVIVAVVIMMVLVIVKQLVDSSRLPIGTVIKIGRNIKERECIVGTFFNMNVQACAAEDIKAGDAEICGHVGELYLIRNVPNYR